MVYFSIKEETKGSSRKMEANPVTSGSTQSSSKRWDDCSKAYDQLTTPSGSSTHTTSSTGANVWIALTDRGSIVEEPKEEGDEEESEEEDKEDMTNLSGKEATRQDSVFGCRSKGAVS